MPRVKLLAPALVVALAAACGDAPLPTAVGADAEAPATPPQDPGGAATTTGPARTIYGLDDRSTLVVFDADRPGEVVRRVPITGTGVEFLRASGIDFRPNDANPTDGDQAGLLYAIIGGGIYTVDPVTGAATLRANVRGTPSFGANTGFGFNPAADVLRLHFSQASSARVDVDAGTTILDEPLRYAAGDVNAGRQPHVVATAYTNSVSPAPASTELFAIDIAQDVLVRLDAPNAGQLATVGPLGIDNSEAVGFDIPGRATGGRGYATFTPPRHTRSFLYRINLADARREPVGPVGHDRPIISIAIDDRRSPGPGDMTPAAQRVAAGSQHSCALDAGGRAYCWGSNGAGELGTSAAGESCRGVPCSTRPVPVSGALTFVSLSAGRAYTCGLTAEGAAHCWGDNRHGKLGNGSTTSTAAPAPVAGGLSFAALHVGTDHSCGVTRTGEAYCWGANRFGELGNRSTTETCENVFGEAVSCSTRPVPVSGGLTFASVHPGRLHSCGLTRAGAAYCWGNNEAGQLGIDAAPERCGEFTCSSIPVAVSGGLAFASLSAGDTHSCGVARGDGTAYCWGLNSWGALGRSLGAGGPIRSATPGAVVGGLTFTSTSAGSQHSCGIAAGGAAHCWGFGFGGALGNGSRAVGGPAPVAVVGGLSFAALSAGGSHSCGVASNGELYCWGVNSNGQLGSSAAAERCAIDRGGSEHACSSAPVRVALE